MQSLATWQLIIDNLDSGKPVVLLYVLESRGSSPGRQGFFMAVDQEGKMKGSIGGGIMEHKFVEMARQLITQQPQATLRRQVHDKDAGSNQSGMICSGEQTIWIYPVASHDLEPLRQLVASLQDYRQGTLCLSPSGIRFSQEASTESGWQALPDNNWVYRERTGYRYQLHIIGGGHCSLALSALMRSMDFYIRVYDDRRDLSTLQANQSAHEKIILSGYGELQQLIRGGPDQLVVIMTFGYRTDDKALRALAGKSFFYLGVLGSKNKISKMLDDYRREGFPAEWLEQIRWPIGLPIRSQTPEEIAVSIAAEIIHVKNRDLP